MPGISPITKPGGGAPESQVPEISRNPAIRGSGPEFRVRNARLEYYQEEEDEEADRDKRNAAVCRIVDAAAADPTRQDAGIGTGTLVLFDPVKATVYALDEDEAHLE